MEAIQQKIQIGITAYIALLQEIAGDFAIFFGDLYQKALSLTVYLPKTTDLPVFLQLYVALLSEIHQELRDAMDTDTIPTFFIPTVTMLLLGSSSFFFVTLIYFTG